MQREVAWWHLLLLRMCFADHLGSMPKWTSTHQCTIHWIQVMSYNQCCAGISNPQRTIDSGLFYKYLSMRENSWFWVFGKKIRSKELLRYFKNLKESVISWKNWWFSNHLFEIFHVFWDLWLYTINVSLIHNFLGYCLSLALYVIPMFWDSLINAHNNNAMQLLFFYICSNTWFWSKNLVLDPGNWWTLKRTNLGAAGFWLCVMCT
jgi:hypothetical protein